ncbi:MAG TPA: 16S rRNA methyltransferase, partial [Nitrospira sp.]|nr:16S rRNA methyltransferase [Nitrospira sp.]
VFFVSPACVTLPTISLTGELLAHLKDSLRVAIGETLWLNDGQGTRYHVEISDVSKHA